MADKKKLILGAMPRGASAHSHLAAGPWCFAGQEACFPDWEKSFTFAPEPFAEDPRLLAPAARAAQYLCIKAIPEMAGELAGNKQNISPVYWQTLLVPWLIDIAKQIVERSLRCEAMLKKWSSEKLLVPVLSKDCDFAFASEHDFILRGALGLTFNHWLFSRLLDKNWPDNWEKIEEPCPRLQPPAQAKANFRDRLRHIARKAQLYLPFPRLKGMSVAKALHYSSKLRHPCHQTDHSINLEEFTSEWPPEIPWQENTLTVFKACLPQSLKNLRHPEKVPSTSQPRLRLATVLAYEDSAYRQKLALWRAGGNRLAYAQHGGNYGQVRVACDTEVVEYSQDVFFTWGWTKHGTCRGNFLPMPYPQLCVIADKWQGQTDNLIFVGTEMAAFPYRLDSRPTPLQFLRYRAAKAEFFENLDETLQAISLYRPYFDLPGTLEDSQWLLPRFPRLKLCRGPLTPHMLGCRLLVLDHHGTTMLEAMAANTPMVLYWNRAHWELTAESAKLLDMLASAGVWQESPKKAAQKVNEVWNDAKAWWNTPEIQRVRLEWLENQARCDSREMDRQWIQTLKTL